MHLLHNITAALSLVQRLIGHSFGCLADWELAARIEELESLILQRMTTAGMHFALYSVCAQHLLLDHMCVSRNDKAVEWGPKIMMKELLHCASYNVLGVCAQPRHPHTERVRAVRAFLSGCFYFEQLLNGCAH